MTLYLNKKLGGANKQICIWEILINQHEMFPVQIGNREESKSL